MNGRKKIAFGLVIACGDRPELLDTAKEILNQVTLFVKLLVVIANRQAASLGRDEGGLFGGSQEFQHPFVRVISLIRNKSGRLHVRQKAIRTNQVMRLASGQMEANRIAERIDQSVDFGAQSTTGSTNGLVFTNFFLAPALSWWARTMVLSIIAYSLSASAARC